MEPSDTASSNWSLIKKPVFCFFFIFFILYIFLNPNEIVPHSYFFHKFYIKPCAGFVVWLGRDVFHIVGPSIKFYNGTIDTVYGYVTVLFIFIAAFFGAVIWQVIDRKAANYNKLYNALIIILRYYLAITFIAYGSFKLVRLQFPPFSPGMLLRAYGNSTPKELAWSFIGYSDGYNYVIGIAEYAAGLLLFFRRTSLLGNIIGLGVLVNVVAFNYSYDVNVKLLATVLLVMALFLLSKNITRLGNVVLFNKTVYPANDAPPFKERWKNIALAVLKCLFIIYIIVFDLKGDYDRTKAGEFSNIKQPLYGIYNVTTFIRNTDTLKPLTTDTTRWKKLIVSSPPGRADVMLMNDSVKKFFISADTIKKEIEMFAQADTSDKYKFTYSRPQKGVLLLHGKWRADSLQIKFREYDLKNFPLMNRGFRWISDHNFYKKARSN